jgi:hypothetical protein
MTKRSASEHIMPNKHNASFQTLLRSSIAPSSQRRRVLLPALIPFGLILAHSAMAEAQSGGGGGTGSGTGGGTGGGKGTIVLNTYNRVLPKMIGDKLGPANTIAKNTGSGFMDPQIKIDDSPSAVAGYATKVPLLIAVTRTSNKVATAANGDQSYMQGGFGVIELTEKGPQVDTMKYVELPDLQGERNFMKPNIVATDKHYVIVAASEETGVGNGNPQVVAYVYTKDTLTPVTIAGTAAGKPVNLVALSGKQDNQQYGPHSIARVYDASGSPSPNSFVMGVQRNNENGYVMRFEVKETNGQVSITVPYFNKVVENGTHCRPDVITSKTQPGVVYMTSVDANAQPANVGVRALSINATTGQTIKSEIIAASNPVAAGDRGANGQPAKYAVQPNIADLNDKFVAVSFQYSEKVRNFNKDANGNGHTGNSNLSMLQLIDKATMKPVGAPLSAVAPYARHAAMVTTLWGPEDKLVPAAVSLGGSSTGTGKGLAQIIPFDSTLGAFGNKDPNKVYELSRYSDVAGLVVRGKRNPNNQARGFIYAVGDVPNPGFGKKTGGFMPEVKSFVASALQGYTDDAGLRAAKRQSIWLSLVPASWEKDQPTVPGNATEKPGTAADGTGSLPRTAEKPTNPAPVVPPEVPEEEDPTAAEPETGGSGCACNAMHTTYTSSKPSEAASHAAMFTLSALMMGFLRRRRGQPS